MFVDRSNVRPTGASTIVPLQPEGRKNPLFLVHGVDGTVDRFKTLVSQLGPDQPVYGIKSQALDGQAALTRIEDMASYYVQQIRALQPNGPYDFLGFSFGGLVALEMAQQLLSIGIPVGMLGMLDNRPMARHTRIIGSESRESHSARRPGRLSVHITQLLSGGALNYARKKVWARCLRILYTSLDAVHVPIPGVLTRASDINWFAAVRYVPRSFAGRITLFETAESAREGDSHKLWATLAGGGLDVRSIPGTHEDLFSAPSVTFLAREISNCLDRFRAQAADPS